MLQIEEIRAELPSLKSGLAEAEESLNPSRLEENLSKIDEKINVPGFWDDPEAAQKIMKEKKSMEDQISVLKDMQTRIEDLEAMLELADEAEGSGDMESAELMYNLLKQEGSR